MRYNNNIYDNINILVCGDITSYLITVMGHLVKLTICLGLLTLANTEETQELNRVKRQTVSYY